MFLLGFLCGLGLGYFYLDDLLKKGKDYYDKLRNFK